MSAKFCLARDLDLGISLLASDPVERSKRARWRGSTVIAEPQNPRASLPRCRNLVFQLPNQVEKQKEETFPSKHSWPTAPQVQAERSESRTPLRSRAPSPLFHSRFFRAAECRCSLPHNNARSTLDKYHTNPVPSQSQTNATRSLLLLRNPDPPPRLLRCLRHSQLPIFAQTLPRTHQSFRSDRNFPKQLRLSQHPHRLARGERVHTHIPCV